MKTNNVLLEKSFAFGLRMFGLNGLLVQKRMFAAADQEFRSGTFIGADSEEAVGGAARRDFVAKLLIARKEARETHYWLRLLRENQTLEPRLADSLLQDAEELIKILTAIILSCHRDPQVPEEN